jgi:activator of 2-hydroxyglutaryl-CoA dehydratase
LNTEILVPEYPEYVGALGAALIAFEMGEQK